MSEERIKELEAEIAAIKKANKPPRVVSIMAKNVKPGDHVNFPTFGFCEVNGYGHYEDSGDTVLNAMGVNGAIHTFPGNQRVQVRRYPT